MPTPLTSSKCCRCGSEAIGTGAASLLFRFSRHASPVRDFGSLDSDYIAAEAPKPVPPSPLRVSRQSQSRVALRQHKHPIVIEDQDLARPFVRLLRTRDMKTAAARAIVAEMRPMPSGGPMGPTLRRIGTSADMSFPETFRK